MSKPPTDHLELARWAKEQIIEATAVRVARCLLFDENTTEACDMMYAQYLRVCGFLGFDPFTERGLMELYRKEADNR